MTLSELLIQVKAHLLEVGHHQGSYGPGVKMIADISPTLHAHTPLCVLGACYRFAEVYSVNQALRSAGTHPETLVLMNDSTNGKVRVLNWIDSAIPRAANIEVTPHA